MTIATCMNALSGNPRFLSQAMVNGIMRMAVGKNVAAPIHPAGFEPDTDRAVNPNNASNMPNTMAATSRRPFRARSVRGPPMTGGAGSEPSIWSPEIATVSG